MYGLTITPPEPDFDNLLLHPRPHRRPGALDVVDPGKLFSELHRIHRLGSVTGRRLLPDGGQIGYYGTNAGGYTLEALLGIRPNGRPAPDFEGWEIKAHRVRDFDKPGNALLTLLTVGPTDGFYREEGPEAFVRRFGYAASNGRPDKFNLYSAHFVGRRNAKTGLTLHLRQSERRADPIVG